MDAKDRVGGAGTLTIRRATPEDAPLLAEMHVASWRAAYRGIVPETVLDGLDAGKRAASFRQGILDGPALTLVAEVAGEAVGFIAFGAARDPDANPAHTGEVWGLYLDPGHWRQGIGTRLLGHALDELTARGCREATLWVLDENTGARRFYEAMGFGPDGTAKEIHIGEPLIEVRYRIRLDKRVAHAAGR